MALGSSGKGPTASSFEILEVNALIKYAVPDTCCLEAPNADEVRVVEDRACVVQVRVLFRTSEG